MTTPFLEATADRAARALALPNPNDTTTAAAIFAAAFAPLVAHCDKLDADCETLRQASRATMAELEEYRSIAESTGATKAVSERDAALAEAAALRSERTALASLLCDVAQLLDGWHSDGTAWSPWDESVRQRVSDAQQRLETSEPS